MLLLNAAMGHAIQKNFEIHILMCSSTVDSPADQHDDASYALGTRVLSELGRGAPIEIYDENGGVFFRSIHDVTSISGDWVRIVLSNERLAYIGFDANCAVVLRLPSISDLEELVYSPVISQDLRDKCSFVEQTRIERIVPKLMRMSRVIPAAICSSAPIQNVLSFDICAIEHFLCLQPKIYLASSTILELTDVGLVKVLVFKEYLMNKTHIAVALGNLSDAPLIRIHSSCFFGDAMGSAMCDCGPQLRECFSRMKKGNFLLLYIDHEGRDIGLVNKTLAYNLQKLGHDTMTANRILGFAEDERSFFSVVEILKIMQIKSCRLLTNNKNKINSIADLGVDVLGQVSMEMFATEHNKRYLQEKYGVI